MNNKGFATPMIIVYILTFILGTILGIGVYKYMDKQETTNIESSNQIIVETK